MVEQICRAGICGQQDVGEAVVVDVGVGRGTCYFWRGEGCPHLRGHFRELSAAQISEQVRGLGVADAFLHALDLVFDVAVGYEDVGPPVVVVVEEEAAEAERDERGASDFGLRGFVDEQAVAFVVVERNHLVGEVADDDAGVPAAVVVGGVGAHSGAGYAVFAEGDAGGDAALFEGSVFLIEVELVRLRVVGDQEVGPAVGVVIEDCDA